MERKEVGVCRWRKSFAEAKIGKNKVRDKGFDWDNNSENTVG